MPSWSRRACRLIRQPGYLTVDMAFGLAVIVVVSLVAWLVVRAWRDRAFRRAAVPAEAEVTDVRWKTVGPLPERDRLAYPLLRFALPDGSLIEARTRAAAAPLEVGDRVAILYLPDDPSRVRVDGTSGK